MPLRNQFVTGPNVAAPAANVLPRLRSGESHVLAGALGIFLQDHSVGAGGNFGTGENASGAPRLKRDRCVPRRNPLANRQFARHCRGLNGITIHGAVISRGHGKVGSDRFCGVPPERGLQ